MILWLKNAISTGACSEKRGFAAWVEVDCRCCRFGYAFGLARGWCECGWWARGWWAFDLWRCFGLKNAISTGACSENGVFYAVLRGYRGVLRCVPEVEGRRMSDVASVGWVNRIKP